MVKENGGITAPARYSSTFRTPGQQAKDFFAMSFRPYPAMSCRHRRETSAATTVAHNVNPNARGENLPCGNAINTPSNVDGWGDLVTSGSYSVVQSNGLLVDVGGKVKFATGDKDKCLSTGKNDYSVFTDIAQQFGNFTAFGGVGWTAKGDPEFLGTTTNYRNPFFANIGGAYKLTASTSLGASYDFRQRLTSRGDPISEMTLFLTHKFTPNLKVQGYAIKGFSDASPNFGVGGLVSVGF